MKTWIDLYNNQLVVPVIEPSTQCVAKCPQCHRTDHKSAGLGKVDWLPIEIWDLDKFKKAFPIETLKSIPSINICGTWGDANTCKDLPEMIKYAIPHATIVLITNLATHTPEWWGNIGKIGGDRLLIVANVDGVDQEMHSKYRRGTNLERILQNMKAASDAGCIIRSNTIIFKHNQDRVEDIFELCKKYGATSHWSLDSNRYFDENGIFKFINEKFENEQLERRSDDG